MIEGFFACHPWHQGPCADGDFHVRPVNDYRPHVASRECWCRPEFDPDEGVVVHNAMDRREDYEQGRRLS